MKRTGKLIAVIATIALLTWTAARAAPPESAPGAGCDHKGHGCCRCGMARFNSAPIRMRRRWCQSNFGLEARKFSFEAVAAAERVG